MTSVPPAICRPARSLRDLCRGGNGVAAVEFVLLAPVLVSSLLLMADVGLAISQKMAMDSVLRTVAQISMADPGLGPVQTALDTLTSGEAFNATATLHCVCSGGGSCTEACSSGGDHVSYVLVATGPYDSMITPFTLDLESRIEVRVK